MLSAKVCTITHKESDVSRKQTRFYQDLQILQKQRKDNPNDERAVFYLAQTLAGLGCYSEALEYYKLRARMGGWEEERYLAMLRAGVCAQTLKKPWPEVQEFFLQAAALRPSRAEALTLLAGISFERSDMHRAYYYASQAARVPFPAKDCLGVLPEVYEFQALNLVHLTALYVGELDAGEQAAITLLERNPDQEEIRKNLEQYREAKRLRLEVSRQ
jgi:tetratricopeptide (TPR) repeat protein